MEIIWKLALAVVLKDDGLGASVPSSNNNYGSLEKDPGRNVMNFSGRGDEAIEIVVDLEFCPENITGNCKIVKFAFPGPLIWHNMGLHIFGVLGSAEEMRRKERMERMMIRWMCGVTLKDRSRSEELRKRLEN